MSDQTKTIHLDRTAFERYFTGMDPQNAARLYKKMSDSFLANCQGKVNILALALKENRINDAMVMAHQLKGVLQNLGGTAIAEQFLKIELEAGQTHSLILLKILENENVSLKTFMQELETWASELTKKTKP